MWHSLIVTIWWHLISVVKVNLIVFIIKMCDHLFKKKNQSLSSSFFVTHPLHLFARQPSSVISPASCLSSGLCARACRRSATLVPLVAVDFCQSSSPFKLLRFIEFFFSFSWLVFLWVAWNLLYPLLVLSFPLIDAHNTFNGTLNSTLSKVGLILCWTKVRT